MLNPVASSTHVPTQAQATPAPVRSAPQATPAALLNDTVQLSAAARIAQEVTETPAQTAHEAASGDQQARRLLAKEAAAAKG